MKSRVKNQYRNLLVIRRGFGNRDVPYKIDVRTVIQSQTDDHPITVRLAHATMGKRGRDVSIGC